MKYGDSVLFDNGDYFEFVKVRENDQVSDTDSSYFDEKKDRVILIQKNILNNQDEVIYRGEVGESGWYFFKK